MVTVHRTTVSNVDVVVSVIGEEGLGVPDTHAPFLTRGFRLFVGIL